jgi:UDP-glucose 4-epimerase
MSEVEKVLCITGSLGYIGKRLLERLRKERFFKKIICTDILPRTDDFPSTFDYHACDIRDHEKLLSIFQKAGVNTVVHLAFIAQPTRSPDFEYDVDVNGTANVMKICEKLGVCRLVVASSDCAYGFFEGTPDYLSEDALIRPTPGFPYSENKAKVEEMLSAFSARNPACSVVILRPCMVIGPNADNTTTRSMKQPAIIGVRGYDPIMQFIHEDDVAEAFFQAAVQDVKGAFNVSADQGLRYSELARFLGKPLIRLPVRLIYPLVEMLYRLRLLPFGKAQLDYIRYPLSIDNTRMKTELQLVPRYTSRQAIESFLQRNGSETGSID